ncbi:Aste57867_10639 [Aphanomyces stellatus]|uniref:Aste57867_10639 protein n=1 Tax=Aphanomyces stellatus TaxID=120398 RepID=A0A485KRH4_9STRA|nr:hypothetical protein As57867_010599 [Aphanomyces stellatus]VFT87511.1 Aste57867_10639 [Aphanomyces stellatus]
MLPVSKMSSCPICQEELPPQSADGQAVCRALCCGGQYCTPCAKEALANGATCVLCRAPVPTTQDEAVAMVRKHAEAGRAWAQSNLGSRYECGRGVPQDAALAARWMKAASEQGDASAQQDLGAYYQLGLGVPASPEQAILWTRKAVAQGNAKAMFNLANMIKASQPDEYKRLLLNSADAGYAAAQSDVGYNYENGADGFPQDMGQATTYFRKAAEGENALAMANLGGRYLAKQWWASAKFWFTAAMAKDETNGDVANVVEQLNDHLTHHCAGCDATPEKLAKCAQCKQVMYCEKACQLRHWKTGHKHDCKLFLADAAAIQAKYAATMEQVAREALVHGYA